jgi:hypothetical protein
MQDGSPSAQIRLGQKKIESAVILGDINDINAHETG